MYIPTHIALEFNGTKVNDRVNLMIPAILCIYPNSGPSSVLGTKMHSTFQLMTYIGISVIKHSQKIHLDFSNNLVIRGAASVMLFAEITRAQLSSDVLDIITITLPKDNNSRQVFTRSDLYAAIKPGGKKKLNNLAKKNLNYQSGVDPNIYAKKLLEMLKKYGIKLERKESNLYCKGVLEAMLNVINHAYSEDLAPKSGIGKRWWQCSFYDPIKKCLVFIIYDKGIGIPETIKKVAPTYLSDAEKIEYIMPKGVSRYTNAPKRGKGSQNILELTDINSESTLLIYSGSGLYLVDGSKKPRMCIDLPGSINGTLIEWQVPYE